jgi:hypothetical protein
MVRTAWLVLAFLLTALPTLRSEKVDNRDFAIDTCYPTPNEIQLAEARARGGKTCFTLRARVQVFGRGDFEDFPERGSRPLSETDKF